jgi:hypothetical protein
MTLSMVNLKEYGLNKKLKKLEKEVLPSLTKIENENKKLKDKEESFENKFKLKKSKHVKRKNTRK